MHTGTAQRKSLLIHFWKESYKFIMVLLLMNIVGTLLIEFINVRYWWYASLKTSVIEFEKSFTEIPHLLYKSNLLLLKDAPMICSQCIRTLFGDQSRVYWRSDFQAIELRYKANNPEEWWWGPLLYTGKSLTSATPLIKTQIQSTTIQSPMSPDRSC